jgi:hypothetical protein
MDFLNLINIKVLFFIVPCVLLVHEIEEWNIYEFHKKSYSSGVDGETKLGGRLWLIFLSLTGFLWTIVCSFIPNTAVSALVMLLLVDFVLLNAIQHIGLTAKTHKYNPGFIFGGVFGLISACFVFWRILATNTLPVWAAAALLCLIIPGIIESAISSKKNKLPRMVEWILRFSRKLEKIMTG